MEPRINSDQDLFGLTSSKSTRSDYKNREPLASRMRPRNLSEYIGQDHILAPGRLLRRAIQADQLTSVIFYGPPGTGKTTLARVIANQTKSNFLSLNAVLSGVQQIREAITKAEEQKKLYDKRTILFVDEVHRWNKSQQDALLPWVENGTFILIGATTENPYFEVNKALVSRSRVFQLEALSTKNLYHIIQQTLSDPIRGYGSWQVHIDAEAQDHLVNTASGDARSLLNALELAIESSVPAWPPPPQTEIHIDLATAEDSIQQRVVLYDKDGDYHYDVISAFIKSIRGSDADAALYWLARMVEAGEDARFIFRRMLISACEDIGLANPQAVSIVESCARAFDRVGLPEGQYHLAHAALYLATSPKSNSSLAFFDALNAIRKEDADVPNHLKDASRDAKDFGHGQGYLYPHAYRDHWIAQQYLPDALVGRLFYTPSDQGYEASIRTDVLRKREVQLAALLDASGDFTSPAKRDSTARVSQDEWQMRLDAGDADSLAIIRDRLFEIARQSKNDRFLIFKDEAGLLTFEASRGSPLGSVTALVSDSKSKLRLEGYMASDTKMSGQKTGVHQPNDAGATLAGMQSELERPQFFVSENGFTDVTLDSLELRKHQYDIILARDPALILDEILAQVRAALPLLSEEGRFVFSVRVPRLGMRMSKLLSKGTQNLKLYQEYAHAEEAFFTNPKNPLFSWDANSVHQALIELHTQDTSIPQLQVWSEVLQMHEKRRITEQDIKRWFSTNSSYGTALRENLSDKNIATLINDFVEQTKRDTVSWEYGVAFFKIMLKRNQSL